MTRSSVVRGAGRRTAFRSKAACAQLGDARFADSGAFRAAHLEAREAMLAECVEGLGETWYFGILLAHRVRVHVRLLRGAVQLCPLRVHEVAAARRTFAHLGMIRSPQFGVDSPGEVATDTRDAVHARSAPGEFGVFVVFVTERFDSIRTDVANLPFHRQTRVVAEELQ